MTWLSKLLAKTGIGAGLPSRQSRVPVGLWSKCTSCGNNILSEKFKLNLFVCENCNHHHHIPITQRIQHTMDEGFSYINIPLPKDDPISFTDSKSYKTRLKESRERCSFNDAFAIVDGTIQSMPIVCLFMDFEFIGGSMGIAVGDAIAKSCSIAIERKIPIAIFAASGGARMQEGMFSLMQMPRSVIYVESVKKAGLPYIAVLTNPTTGGVLASFAMRASVTIAEPNAVIGFTGQRVIKDTLGIKLPKGFQSSEFVFEKGFLDQIVHRKDMRKKLSQFLSIINHTK